MNKNEGGFERKERAKVVEDELGDFERAYSRYEDKPLTPFEREYLRLCMEQCYNMGKVFGVFTAFPKDEGD